MHEPPDVGEKPGDLLRRNRELSVLNAVARELNRSIDLNETLRFTLARVADLLGLRTGWVWLSNEKTGEFYLAASRDLPPALADDPKRMNGEGYCYCLDTYKRGDLRGAANVNVVTCSRLSGLLGGTEGLKYHASIPLYTQGGKKLGIMNVTSPDWRSLSSDDLQLLYTVGDLLGIAVERARLSERSLRLGAAEERNRLAREIHDTLAQGLAATGLQLESADALLETTDGPERVRSAVRQALSLNNATLEEARRSVLDLRAAPLEGRPLPEALKALVEDWRDAEGIAAEFESLNAGRPLSSRVEVALYRICQEALANVARHARATRVSTRLVMTPEWARLTVEDDGQGFNAGQSPKGHYGLVGMNERARMLGGTLDVRTGTGPGTRIEATVPLLEDL